MFYKDILFLLGFNFEFTSDLVRTSFINSCSFFLVTIVVQSGRGTTLGGTFQKISKGEEFNIGCNGRE